MAQDYEEEGHVSSWPAFVEKNWTCRTLAYYDQTYNRVVDEHDQAYELDEELATLIECLRLHNLLLFVDQLVTFRFLPALLEAGYQVNCSKQGHPTAARIPLKRGTRWIVQADAWQYRAGPTMLRDLREVFDLCGVGTPLTPSGLGQALMRRTFKEKFGDTWMLHTYRRPGMSVCHDLLDHSTGGRVDTPGLGQLFDIISELDEKNAYAFHYLIHPCGTAIRVGRGTVTEYATWFGRCTVEIVKPLALGPFPLRTEHGKKVKKVAVSYPTEPGVYESWLWKEQAEDCRLLGCNVQLEQGWAWNQWTTVNAEWVSLVEQIRDKAPPIFKQAIVAGIGRHGSREYHYSLVDGEHKMPGDQQVSDNDPVELGQGVLYDWYVRGALNEQYNAQPHWFSWTLKECARELFWKALYWKEKEMLAYTNYDAIGIIGDVDVEGIPEKGSLAASMLKSGGWRKELLTNVYIKKPRHIKSDQKVRQPGVPKK